jgi:YbbR domain-containing protein
MAAATRSRAGASSIGRWVTDNLGLKLIALGLSLMLFSLVHSDVDAQRSMYLDVVALLPPPGSGQMLISELPAQVKVTLRGSRSKLSSLSRDQMLPVQMDLRNASSGNYYLDPLAIDVGGNVQVLEISPAMVPLTWVVAASKRVNVQVELEGDLDTGRRLLGEAQTDPASVTLRGPEERLRSLNTVSTEPVSLVGLGVGSHRRRVPLMPLPEHVTYLEDTAVEVKLVVTPVLSERTFKRLEVGSIGDDRLELRPHQVMVTLRGSRNLLDELEPDAIVPYVEIATAGPAATRPYDIKLRGVPEGVEVVRVLPPSVLGWPKGKR